MTLRVAIDGPVASGKTVVGRALARRMAMRFMDTGTMYRAVTLAALGRGLDTVDGDALTDLARTLDVTLGFEEGEQRIMVDGADVTDEIRSRDVEAHVSAVSAVSGVRRALVDQQRRIAGADDSGIVVAGRDIGTVVLPDAEVKAYLEASLAVRARRRHDELRRRGERRDLSALTEDVSMRDKIDSERADSPLRPAVDAAIIDTDGLRIDQVVTKIQDLIGRI